MLENVCIARHCGFPDALICVVYFADNVTFVDDCIQPGNTVLEHIRVDNHVAVHAQQTDAQPAVAARPRGRPLGSKDKKPRQRRSGHAPVTFAVPPVTATAVAVVTPGTGDISLSPNAGGATANAVPRPTHKRRLPQPRAPRPIAPELCQLLELSVTISAVGTDVDLAVWNEFQQWATSGTVACFASTERGSEKGHLHIQAVMRIVHKDSRTVSALLRSVLRLSRFGVGVYNIKVVHLKNEGLHTFAGLVGYCMKEHLKPHYREFMHNISDEELDVAPLEFAVWGASELKSKQVLTSANLYERMQHFVEHYPSRTGVREGLVPCLTRMIRTARYHFDSRFVTPMNGFGMDPVKADMLWQVTLHPKQAKAYQIAAIVCVSPQRHADRYASDFRVPSREYAMHRQAEREYEEGLSDWNHANATYQPVLGRGLPVGCTLYNDSEHSPQAGDDFIPLPTSRGVTTPGIGKGISITEPNVDQVSDAETGDDEDEDFEYESEHASGSGQHTDEALKDSTRG